MTLQLFIVHSMNLVETMLLLFPLGFSQKCYYAAMPELPKPGGLHAATQGLSGGQMGVHQRAADSRRGREHHGLQGAEGGEQQPELCRRLSAALQHGVPAGREVRRHPVALGVFQARCYGAG